MSVRMKISKTVGSVVCACVIAVLSLQTSGCVVLLAGGAAAGGTAYVMGELKVSVSASSEQLQSAIVKAGRELGLIAVSGAGDAMVGKYVFRNAKDDKIVVTYEMTGTALAELHIRVGNFGDEVLSRQLEQAIRKHL